MDLSSILGSFEPITLDQTNEQASLLKRMDTKYVIRPVQLPEVLSRWALTHRILEIENKRIFGYHSVYYDTPGLQLYHAHHSGAGNRVKFRTREYTDSQLCFYEIKMRNNKGVTEKQRIRIKESTEVTPFLRKAGAEHSRHVRDASLQETLCVEYDRITLVAKDRSQRITIDLNLHFSAGYREIDLRDRIIIEIKCSRISSSDERQFFRNMGIRKGSISKYCLGILSLFPGVKYHRFKLPLRILAKQLTAHGAAASTC